MAQPLLSDALWQRIEPLLPKPKPRRFRFPGRKPLTNRQALTGILFVLRTGIRWNDLPCEMGCGSGSACRKRLQLWQELGIWDQLHHLLLNELQEADQIDWSRAAVDSSFARAMGGGEDTGPNPTDRGKKGSKHHAVVDAQGIPLSATVTAANVPDVTELLDVVDAIPPVVSEDVQY
jgi:transposase